MAHRYDLVHRLEPGHVFGDLARGLAAEVADPVWFLGRQWQLGEHQGEDAASPLWAEYRAELTPLDPFDGDPRLDPTSIPAEAIVEAAPGDFWTAGRRVAAGRQVAAAAAAVGRPLPADPELLLQGLPVPYDALDGSGPDGRVLYERRAALGLDDDWFGERPPEPPARDLWNPAELRYDADFTADGSTLALRRHDGGDLDWYSVDATVPPAPQVPPPAATALVSRVTYPGAPNPRWWQIEEAGTDLGAYPPDRSHFATLLLIEAVVSHGDDWFTFPVPGRAGHVVALQEVTVHDSFGDTWTVAPPADGWSLFSVDGLGPGALVVWPAVATPLTGPVLDQVDLGADEDANLVWAVERRVAGRDLPTPERPQPPVPGGRADAGEQPRYAYLPSTDVPPYWHPYLVEQVGGRRRLVQGRLADLSGAAAVLTPEPASELLRDPAAGGVHPVHQLEPAAVPTDGLTLERRYILGRGTDGAPVLWVQRRRGPLAAPPVQSLRLDVLRRA
jgi:hypothetical protein